MSYTIHYPSFNVMKEKDAWDDHTQSIVIARLTSALDYLFLTQQEAELLSVLCSILVDDSTADVLQYVISHIDQTLFSSIGESQRKAGVPPEKELIRQGLLNLDHSAKNAFALTFVELDRVMQKQLLQNISEAKEPLSIWTGITQQAFFQKLLKLTIESYCSHPKIWSNIGYAGPAYPRGYIRTDIGQLDPWEARLEQ